MTIAAIQTQYNGVLFRSRLEARWAVFFDTLGIKYCYEAEGYSLPSGNYLPDFYIPNQRWFQHKENGLFVEIKGVATDKSHNLLDELALHTGIDCTMLGELPYGDSIDREPPETTFTPAIDKEWSIVTRCKRHSEDCKYWEDDASCDCPLFAGCDHPYVWCECPFCKRFGFEFDGRSARIGCACKDHESVRNGDKTYNSASFCLLNAYQKARSERFEDWRAA
jgi:hypothetical protein